jgi:hypothetical protein
MKKLVTRVKNQLTSKLLAAQNLLRSQRGEGFVDTAIKILMAVVIGALVLGGLYALFGETVMFSSRYKHDRKCYA